MISTPSTNILLAAVLAAVCGIQLGNAGQNRTAAQQGSGQPGTQWSDAQIKDTVDIARVARKLTPKVWPDGARVAVCLSFDDDTQAPLLRDGTTSATTLSASDFGAESGTPRILKILDRYRIPATFFVTGVDAMIHPEMLQAIMKSGRNEIGIHGWIHEFPPRLADGEEERLLDKAIDYMTKATGKKPVGYRAPVLGLQFSYARSDPEKGISIRQQSSGVR